MATKAENDSSDDSDSEVDEEALKRAEKARQQQNARSGQDIFTKILIPINVKSTHWYLGILQQQVSGEYQLRTQNNCSSIINDQAENNLRAVGKVLSRLARQSSEIDTPTKYQHQLHPNFNDVQSNSEAQIQDGRTR